jgi:hypothetical protein
VFAVVGVFLTIDPRQDGYGRSLWPLGFHVDEGFFRFPRGCCSSPFFSKAKIEINEQS